MSRRTLEIDGKQVTGEDIAFEIVTDGTVTLRLADGAVLRLKPVVFNVVKMDHRNADKERTYLVQVLNQVVMAEPPEEDRDA